MAKGLKTLIRLSEWTVDEKRRELGIKLENLATLEDNLDALGKELIREQTSAASSPQEAGLYYGNYADQVIARREQLHVDIADMEHQVSEARDALNEAYRELKKYEVAEQTRKDREAKELDRKEQILLDDLAIQNFTAQPD